MLLLLFRPRGVVVPPVPPTPTPTDEFQPMSYLDDSRGGTLVGPPAFIRHDAYVRKTKRRKRLTDWLYAIYLLDDDE